MKKKMNSLDMMISFITGLIMLGSLEIVLLIGLAIIYLLQQIL